MLTVQGYFDGVAIRPLEKMIAKPNQRVIITVMDEFVEPAKKVPQNGIRGILSQYADPSLAEKEKGAWERAVVERYGDTRSRRARYGRKRAGWNGNGVRPFARHINIDMRGVPD